MLTVKSEYKMQFEDVAFALSRSLLMYRKLCLTFSFQLLRVVDRVATHRRGLKLTLLDSSRNSYWFGKTISHTMTITYGLSGSISYAAYSDTNLRRPLITYSAKGDMGSSASLKFGNYRAAVSGISAATAYVGDLVSTRLS
jgi:hypothetical protein